MIHWRDRPRSGSILAGACGAARFWGSACPARRRREWPVRAGRWWLPSVRRAFCLVVRHVIIFGYGHGLQRAIIDESQHRTPERLVMAQH